MPKDGPKCLKDFAVGDWMRTGEIEVTRESLHAFAKEFDPQAIHLDEAAAKASFFGELVGSGWHAAALTMKLMVESRPLGSTPIIGLEVHQFRFEAPLKPGDRLHVEAMVIGTRQSGGSKRGYLTLALWTRRSDGAAILTQQWTLLMPTRG